MSLDPFYSKQCAKKYKLQLIEKISKFTIYFNVNMAFIIIMKIYSKYAQNIFEIFYDIFEIYKKMPLFHNNV